MRTIDVFLDVIRDGKTVELLVSSECTGPDPECGIFGAGIEGIFAEELGTKTPFELTEEEAAEAAIKIQSKYMEDDE